MIGMRVLPARAGVTDGGKGPVQFVDHAGTAKWPNRTRSPDPMVTSPKGTAALRAINALRDFASDVIAKFRS